MRLNIYQRQLFICLVLVLGFSLIIPVKAEAVSQVTLQLNESALLIEDSKEIPELRTPYSKTFETNVTGEMKQEISTHRLHFETIDGQLYDINTSLTAIDSLELEQFADTSQDLLANRAEVKVNSTHASLLKTSKHRVVSKENYNKLNQLKSATNDKQLQRQEKSALQNFYTSLEVPFEFNIAKNIVDGYSMRLNGTQLTFIPIGAKASIGKVDSEKQNVIRYENPWPSTILSLTVTSDGIKEEIVLKDNNAPKKLSFEVRGELDKQMKAGDLLLSPAWLTDSNGIWREVKMSLNQQQNKTYLNLEWDQSGLNYPITIDPTVTINFNRDYHVCNTYSDQTYYPETIQVGTSYSKSCSAFLEFSTTSIPEHALVTSATLTMLAYSTTTEPAFKIAVRQLMTPVSRNGNVQPPLYTAAGEATAIIPNTSGSKGASVSWSIGEIVKNAHSNGVLFLGMYVVNQAYVNPPGIMEVVYAYGPPTLTVYYSTNAKKYQYDANNRLVAIKGSTNLIQKFEYDSRGNLIRSYMENDESLLKNGDFSNGKQNWNIQTPFTLNGAKRKDHINSLQFSATQPLTQTAKATSYPHRGSASQNYTLSGYIMDNTTSGNLYVTVKEYNYYYGELQSTTKKISPTTRGTNQWTYFSNTFKTSSLTAWITVSIDAEVGTKGEAYVDVLKLLPVN